MKRKLIFILLFFFIFIPIAQSKQEKIEEIYSEQFKLIEAEKILKALPEKVVKSLENMGIKVTDLKQLSKISPIKFLDELIRETKDKSSIPIKSFFPTIAMILLCSIIDSIDISLGNLNISEIMSIVASICICINVISPITKFIISTSNTIKITSEFIMSFIPVMVGIMIASGQTVSASSYHMMMSISGQVISSLCTNFLVPLMNTVISVSVMSSLAPRLKLDGISKMIYKTIKCLLGISVSTFSALLALQNLVAFPADNIGSKTAKLALSSFVPIVGGALGDAFNTVQSCLKLLKSGLGVFAIAAMTILFLPKVIECLMWIFFLSASSFVSSVLTQGKIEVLLESLCQVIKLLLAIILSCTAIFIISTMIILIIGNGG